MSRMKDVVQWQTLSGEAVRVGDVALTPQSQALTVRFRKGGFVWNRPVAVLVERDGQMERIPVVDVTRIVQLILLGLTSVFFVITLMLSIRKRRDKK